jgi:hypothetical protein
VTFGDDDPEDAFDAGDSGDEQLAVLERLAGRLEVNGLDDRSAARIEWAEEIAERLARRPDVDTERARDVARRLAELAEAL